MIRIGCVGCCEGVEDLGSNDRAESLRHRREIAVRNCRFVRNWVEQGVVVAATVSKPAVRSDEGLCETEQVKKGQAGRARVGVSRLTREVEG